MSQPVSTSARNPAIELYRVMLMFGICLLHAVQQGPYCKAWFSYLFMFTVTGFVFISGWFGISFKPSKVLKLLAIALFSVPITWVLTHVQSHEMPMLQLVIQLKYCWFLWAYLALLLLSPLLNAAFGVMTPNAYGGIMVPLLILVSGWGVLAEVRYFCEYFPKTPGIGSHSCLMMVVVYLVARCWRRFGWFLTFRTRTIVLILIPFMGLALIGIAKYSSLVCIAIAGLLFVLSTRLTVPRWMSTLVSLMGPSVFTVYLAHTNYYGFELIRLIETHLMGIKVNVYFTYLIAAVCVFTLCVLLDIPRRMLASFLSKLLKQVCELVDEYYERLINWTAVWCNRVCLS